LESRDDDREKKKNVRTTTTTPSASSPSSSQFSPVCWTSVFSFEGDWKRRRRKFFIIYSFNNITSEEEEEEEEESKTTHSSRTTTMSSIATQRLMAERKAWRKDRPFGFSASPMKDDTGTSNFFKWKCMIPGPKDTIWDQGFYPVTMEFSKDYPVKPPKCKFPEGFYHPNIYPSGTVCLSILNEEEGWSPSITLKQILLGIQDLLKSPNPKSPAQSPAYVMYTQDRTEYNRLVKEQSKKYPAPI
tara:strand:- start:27 stop:758 length:732 start_codon:yes stop_codon:yes gene_type:complete